MPSVQLRSFGGLNSDSHVQDIRNGDYTDAKNIEHISAEQGESLAITPRTGNTYAFDLGTVQARNKVYRIRFPRPEPNDPDYRIRITNLIYNLAPLQPWIINISSAVTAANDIESVMNGVGYDVNVVFEQQTSEYTQYRITPVPGSLLDYYDYNLESVGDNAINLDIIQESISTSRSGDLEVIGSCDLLGDLFIISSTKRDEPIEIPLIATTIVSISPQIFFFLPFDNLNDLSVGQEVYVTGLSGSLLANQANGLYIINQITPDPINNVVLIRCLYNNYGGIPGFENVTGGTITLNPFGLGEIGVATKDESKDTWTYTRLLRSKDLNLWVKYRCDVQCEISTMRKSIYFTDNYNVPKVFYYYDEAPYIIDGAIEAINSQYGTYVYGLIDLQTNLFTSSTNTFNIDFVSQDLGGSLPAGNMRYFVRAVFSDGSNSNWSLPSNPIPVYDAPVTSPKLIKGDVAGTQTSKQNTIRISGFDSRIVRKVQVAAISYLDIGVQTTAPLGIIGEFNTTIGSNEIIITHTGGEIGLDLIPEELSIQNILYTRAKNNAIIDNRYVLSNLSTSDYDYEQLLNFLTYSIEKKSISRVIAKIDTFASTESFTYGGFQDPSNVFYHTGYMINETYRFGARVVLKNGIVSDVFKIFDVTIDTNSTSPDGKRISGLSDYLLVNDQPVNTDDLNYVPHIRIYCPDLKSVTLNGYVASDIVERIEIFRVELDSANESIKGCGLAINCFNLDNSNPYIEVANVDPTYDIRFIKNTTTDYIVERPVYNTNVNIQSLNHGVPVNASAIYLVDDFLNSFDTSSVKNINDGDLILNYGQPVPVFTNTFQSNILRSYLNQETASALQVTEIKSSVLSSADQEGNIQLFNAPNQILAAKKYGTVNRFQQRYLDSIIFGKMVQNTIFGRQPYPGPPILFTTNSKYIKLRYNGVVVVEYTLTGLEEISNVDFINIVNASNGPISCTGLNGDNIRYFLNGNFVAPGLLEFVYQVDLPISPEVYVLGVFNNVLATNSVVYDNQFSNKTGYIVSYGAGTNNQGIPNIDSNPLLQFNLPAPAPQQPDKSIRYVQIKRKVQDQYPDGVILNYVYTGAYIDTINNQSSVDVFGGDAYTVTFFAKTFTRTGSVPATIVADKYRYSQALWVTGQTKKNIHLIHPTEGNKIYPYSYANQNIGFTDWISTPAFDTNPYNTGYNTYSLLYGYRANDISIFKRNDYKTRIIYSDLKPQGSTGDSYRAFGLLSYTDLDASFGEIVDMKNVNGELFTLQPNKYQRQFFNTRGTLQLSDATEIVLGDASVLSRPGVTLTSYGCSNKWSVLLGKSQGGNDILYWYDKTRKKFVRFGSDGTVPLSDRANTRTISADGLRWLLDYDTATLNYGMHGVWNSRLGEAIWTVRAYRKPDYAWFETDPNQQAVTFNVGDITYLEDETNFINFEQTIVLYVVTVQHSSALGIKPGVTPGWENYFDRPSVDDISYYSIRTISFSEYKNRFNQFQETYHPKIYLPWKDTYLSPRPKDPRNKIYEHNVGDILRWYLLNGDLQEEEGFIEVVFNIDPNITKRYIALICNSEVSPYRLELQTRTQETVINGPEFEQQLEQFFAAIPNVELGGLTTADNDFMYGQWVKIRFYYQPGEFQRFTNIVLKFNPMVRLWNT